MRDPSWPAERVSDGHRDCQAVRREQDELFQTQAGHNRLQVQEPGVKRVVAHVAVRKPGAATVVADQHPSAGNLFVPGTPLGYLGVPRGKAEGDRWHPYKRRSLPQDAEGDAHPVGGLGVLGGRLHHASSRTAHTRTGSPPPLSDCSPRSSQDKPPAGRGSGRTVPDTSTSPGADSPLTRAAMLTAPP